MNEHKAATANVAGLGPSYGQGESDGHSSINGIAAFPEHVSTNATCRGRFRYDHSQFAASDLDATLIDAISGGAPLSRNVRRRGILTAHAQRQKAKA
jgi:hypothetical protein